ncbi:MAG: DUF4062 domain-containing protein, partial [Cyanobacteria bacterium J06600_6]
MMEQLPALDADAIEASLAMVDESDIYIGIFAHRYGYVPEGHDISITEMEYRRAVERGMPILIFVMSDEVLVRPSDIDRGIAAIKLDELKTKLKKRKVVDFFENPQDLRGLVLDSLGKIKAQLKETDEEEDKGKLWASKLHYTSPIPVKPEPFIAHPYTLLQVKGLIGRKPELELLTDWITKPSLADISIFNIVAIGGMGKSALTWTWFNKIAPQEKQWAGRIWWSFYETDATFENFVRKTLAYVSGRPEDEIKRLPASEQQQQLFQILHAEPYLIVFDGLERILMAYASQNAAFLDDDTALDDRTANRIAGAMGLPESGGQSFVGRHRLRKTTDSRIGHFLRQLTQLKESKVLVSTRLYPADLQTRGGRPLPKCFALFLPGLSDQNALELWRIYGAKGSREEMLPTLQSFDKHPLLLQLLASEVAEYRAAPGNFTAWRKANPEFNVFGLPLVQVQSHVLTYALKGLSPQELQTLHIIAGFRMPVSMETLKALLIQGIQKDQGERQSSLFYSERGLDYALTNLEDKGLLGWDRQSNRYDLHPIVRGVVWNNMGNEEKYGVYGSLRTYFEAMPAIEDTDNIESVEDLRPPIELFNSLVNMKLYREAYLVYRDQLSGALFYRLGANKLRIELLIQLFNDDFSLTFERIQQAYLLNSLGQSYAYTGELKKAINLFSQAVEIYKVENKDEYSAIVSMNMALVRFAIGELYLGGSSSKANSLFFSKSSSEFDKVESNWILGFFYFITGIYDNAETIWLAAECSAEQGSFIELMVEINRKLSEIAIRLGHYELATSLLSKCLKFRGDSRDQRNNIRLRRSLGKVHLYKQGKASFSKVEEDFNYALRTARATQLVEEEIQTLTALAELHRRKNELAKAREYLDDIWDYAEEG